MKSTKINEKQWRVDASGGRFAYLRNTEDGWYVVTPTGQAKGPFNNRFNCKMAAEQWLSETV